ncbi:MAG TPA: response regulator [Stenotrophomonas sp.]|jgi:FixJ family two-component response regulator
MSAIVYVVDDDADVLTALGRSLTADGLRVKLSQGPEQFLQAYDPTQVGCVVLDLHMPGMSGLQLQAQLSSRGQEPPLIFLSGSADVASCASAMRAGAIDFLTKPVDADILLAAVERGFEVDTAHRVRHDGERAACVCYDSLSPREKEVLPHIVAGRLNKQIADKLGISLKTTKVHRSRILQKFGVRSVADLVRSSELAHIAPAAA